MSVDHNALEAQLHAVSSGPMRTSDSTNDALPFDSASHKEFADLLRGLRKVSLRSDNDALPVRHKQDIRRAVLSLSAMLADARSLIAGETLPAIPVGCLSSMEYELIVMDYRGACAPATTLFQELDTIHGRAEAMLQRLAKRR